MASSAPKRKAPAAKGPSPNDWASKKPLIKALYLDQDKTLPEVQRILFEEHGFDATYVGHPSLDGINYSLPYHALSRSTDKSKRSHVQNEDQAMAL